MLRDLIEDAGFLLPCQVLQRPVVDLWYVADRTGWPMSLDFESRQVAEALAECINTACAGPQS